MVFHIHDRLLLLLHCLKLLVFLIGLADTRCVRHNSLVQAFQCVVEVLLVRLSVTIEVAVLIRLHVGWDKDSISVNVTSSRSLFVK